jgi:hypothetical protein
MSAEKGGALRTQTTRGRRAVLALLFSATLVVAPLVLVHGPATTSRPARPATDGRALPGGIGVGAPAAGAALAGYRIGPPSVRPTAGPPAPAAATTTTVPSATTTTVPPTTTTTEPPTPTAAAVPAPGDGSVQQAQQGLATWYPEAPPGGCASPTLAFGTQVQVTDSSTGATTTCVVDDREAPNPGRVVDLSYSGFSQLADPSQGVATVTVSW